MTLHLINRSPEPDEENVPISTSIELEVANDAATGIDLAATEVYLNGVLAFDGGVFQAGFTGPDSATSAPFADVRRITIDPTTDYASEETVTVRVVSADVGAAASIDSSYQFFIQDLTAPRLVAAKGVALNQVQVTFDEAMEASSALLPGAYVLTRQEAPAVNVEVVSVAVGSSPEEFILTTDINLTHGTQYMLVVTGPEDLSGNVISSSFNTALFDAFTPQVPAGRRFDIWLGMIPRKNRQEDQTGDLRKMVSVWQETTDQCLFSIDAWTDLLDPDLAPEAFVDAMLCDLGNPFEFILSLNDKRRLVQTLVPIYKQKGLATGIINAVRFFLGIEVTITLATSDGMSLGESELGFDWELGPGDIVTLYTFLVNTTQVLTAAQTAQITSIANYMKPAHTHLGGIVVPSIPVILDHWELGLSELSTETELH